MSGKNNQTRPTSTAANGGGGSSSLASSQKRRNCNEGGDDGARSSSVAGPSSQVVNDLAAAIGPQTTDKSCRTCRVRKVKVSERRLTQRMRSQADRAFPFSSAIGNGRNVSAVEIAAIPVRWLCERSPGDLSPLTSTYPRRRLWLLCSG